MAESIPNLVKDISILIQETEQIPNTVSEKKFKLRHSILNILKTKGKKVSTAVKKKKKKKSLPKKGKQIRIKRKRIQMRKNNGNVNFS